MQLEIKTAVPIHGYWDYGAKSIFTLSLGRVGTDKNGEYQRVHCFEANIWYHVTKSKTEKKTLSNAIPYIKKVLGVPFTYLYIED